jgi:hypothetical protein
MSLYLFYTAFLLFFPSILSFYSFLLFFPSILSFYSFLVWSFPRSPFVASLYLFRLILRKLQCFLPTSYTTFCALYTFHAIFFVNLIAFIMDNLVAIAIDNLLAFVLTILLSLVTVLSSPTYIFTILIMLVFYYA